MKHPNPGFLEHVRKKFNDDYLKIDKHCFEEFKVPFKILEGNFKKSIMFSAESVKAPSVEYTIAQDIWLVPDDGSSSYEVYDMYQTSTNIDVVLIDEDVFLNLVDLKKISPERFAFIYEGKRFYNVLVNRVSESLSDKSDTHQNRHMYLTHLVAVEEKIIQKLLKQEKLKSLLLEKEFNRKKFNEHILKEIKVKGKYIDRRIPGTLVLKCFEKNDYVEIEPWFESFEISESEKARIEADFKRTALKDDNSYMYNYMCIPAKTSFMNENPETIAKLQALGFRQSKKEESWIKLMNILEIRSINYMLAIMFPKKHNLKTKYHYCEVYSPRKILSEQEYTIAYNHFYEYRKVVTGIEEECHTEFNTPGLWNDFHDHILYEAPLPFDTIYQFFLNNLYKNKNVQFSMLSAGINVSDDTSDYIEDNGTYGKNSPFDEDDLNNLDD